VCSPNNLVCEQCESGFIVGLNSLCVRGTARDIVLTDIEIVGKIFNCVSVVSSASMMQCVFAAIVVGCAIAFILFVALAVCFTTWACKFLLKKPQYVSKRTMKKKIVRYEGMLLTSLAYYFDGIMH
jgi:hypothetical protein